MSTTRHAIVLLVLLGVCIPLLWFFRLFPYNKADYFFQSVFPNNPAQLQQVFPADLIVSVTNGEVSLNQPYPYCLYLDAEKQYAALFHPVFDPTLLLNQARSTYSCPADIIVSDRSLLYLNTITRKQEMVIIPRFLNLTISKTTLAAVMQNHIETVRDTWHVFYFMTPVIGVVVGYILMLTLAASNAVFISKTMSILKLSSNISYHDAFKASLKIKIILIALITLTVLLFPEVLGVRTVIPSAGKWLLLIMTYIIASIVAAKYCYDQEQYHEVEVATPWVKSSATKQTPTIKTTTTEVPAPEVPTHQQYTFDPRTITKPT